MEIILMADEDAGDDQVDDDDTFIYYIGDDAYSSGMTSYDTIGTESGDDIQIPAFQALFVLAALDDPGSDWASYTWTGSEIEKITITMVAGSTSTTDIVKVKEYKFEDVGGDDHGESQDFGDYDSLSDADWDSLGGASIVDTSDDTLYLRSTYLQQYEDYYIQYAHGYEPVCGCDGLTYFNEAEAERLGVNVDYSGVCNISQPIGLADSAWPCWGHDIRHTGLSPYIGTQTNELKWSYKVGKDLSGIFSSPVIGANGTVYMVNSGKVSALSPNGKLKWSYNLGGSSPYWGYGGIFSPPVISADGTVYTVTYSGIYALNPNGSLRKIFHPESSYYESYISLIIGSDGTFYTQGYNAVYAIDPNDNLKWSYPVREGNYYGGYGYGGYGYGGYGYPYGGYYGYGGAKHSPAIDLDGTVYVSGIVYENSVYALDPNGILKWSYYAEGSYPYHDYYESGGFFTSPVITSDGTVYVGSNDHKIYAIDPNGELKWSYQTGGGVYSSAAIGADGTVYVGSDDHKIYALKPNGTLKWSYQTDGGVYSSAAIGADGTIYVGSDDHKIYALKPNGTLKWSYKTEASVDSQPAIGTDGTVYAVNNDGKLYAFKSSKSQQGSGISGPGWPGSIFGPGNIISPWSINTGWQVNTVWPGNIGFDWPKSVLPGGLVLPDGISTNWQGISSNWRGNTGILWSGMSGWTGVSVPAWPGITNFNLLQSLGSHAWPISANIGWTGNIGSAWSGSMGNIWPGSIGYSYINFPGEVAWPGTLGSSQPLW